MDIHLLVNVTSRAWALPILAALSKGVPARQAALITATGAGRTAFGQSLSHLLDLGLITRNPGYGHPLRPEFCLTPAGAALGAGADQALKLAKDAQAAALIRRMWTVPILTVTTQPVYFGAIKQSLGGVTDRALSQSLQRLQQQRWISRDVDQAARPLRARYAATLAGAQIGHRMRQAIRP